MRIFEMILFEYIIGYILQGFAIILGIFAFNQRKIEIKKFLLSSGIVIVVLYVMRLLPISFGIHTILDLIFEFLLGILYLKMPAFSVIRSILVVTVLLLITELLNVIIMTNILGKELFSNMMNDNINKYIIGLPAALVFAIIILISYFLFVKNKKGEKNGKSSA